MAVARLHICNCSFILKYNSNNRNSKSDVDIRIYLDVLFVDDCRFLTSPLLPGVRWSHEEKSFIFKEEWKISENLSKQQRTTLELCNGMNLIFSNIKFTVESESDFLNNRLPTLDCEPWIENGKYLRYCKAKEKSFLYHSV